MPTIKAINGVNLRLPAYSVGKDQMILTQNMDMTHQEILEQIKGSRRFHGESLGTVAPTAIIPYYNNNLETADVLVGVDDKILKKNTGSNEFETLISNLTPNKLNFSVNIENKEYFAHPDGLLEFDGIQTILKIPGGPQLKDIIFSKETNRAFGLDANIPNQVLWTDDLTTTGGVPLTWAALNANVLPPTEGDVIEKLWFLSGRLIFLMTNSTWIEYVNGQPQNWRFEKSPTTVGWIAPKTIKQVGLELWGLGFSPASGRGLYAFNGRTSRLLSYDVEPELNRINEFNIQRSVAEHVNNIYKLSYARDSALENDHTLHFDTINQNQKIESPNVYGPHTYGFSASAVLNTRKFKGQHLFALKHNDEARVFEVTDFKSQHATGLTDDGDLIPTILVTGIFDTEETAEGILDDTWFKRFSNIFASFPPKGAWSSVIEILKDHLNETHVSYRQILEAGSRALGAIDLGSDALNLTVKKTAIRLQDVVSTAIQFKISNTRKNTTSSFSSFSYDAKPVRREKGINRVRIV